MAKGKKKVKKTTVAKKAPAKKPVKKTVKKAAKKATRTSPAKAATAKKTNQRSAPRKVSAKIESKNKTAVKWSEFVTPLDDRLIVQLNGQERKTAGGLFIPDTAADISGNRQGVAVSVGRGHRDAHGKIRPMDVQIGDRVVFAEYAGSKIELLGETLILLRESEVMGILT